MALKITYVFFTLFVFSHLTVACESSSVSSSALTKKSQSNVVNNVQRMPVITNEAEYAAWVKQREAGRASAISKSSATSLRRASSSPARN